MLKEKVAIITGARKGIGRAIADVFVREGAYVVLNSTNEEALQAVCEEIRGVGGRASAVAGDVADPNTAKRIADCALREYGRIDVLVNNAGYNSHKPFLELEPEEWLRMMDVNLNGPFYMLKACLPVMVAQRSGSVVNVSSSTSKTPHATAAASYPASKGGLNALTRQLALEMAKYNVRVNAVCPGPTETDMAQKWTDEFRKSVMEKVPLKRIGKPEEIAEVVAFLASDRASFIIGEAININGGTYMD